MYVRTEEKAYCTTDPKYLIKGFNDLVILQEEKGLANAVLILIHVQLLEKELHVESHRT